MVSSDTVISAAVVLISGDSSRRCELSAATVRASTAGSTTPFSSSTSRATPTSSDAAFVDREHQDQRCQGGAL